MIRLGLNGGWAALSGLIGPLRGMPHNDAETRKALRILSLDRLTPERHPDGAVTVRGVADFSSLCGVQKGAEGAVRTHLYTVPFAGRIQPTSTRPRGRATVAAGVRS